MLKMHVDKQFFKQLECFDVVKLAENSNDCLTSVLPLLTRCALCASSEGTTSSLWMKKRQILLQKLLNFNEVNFLIESLSTDFNEVYSDCRNSISLRYLFYYCRRLNNYCLWKLLGSLAVDLLLQSHFLNNSLLHTKHAVCLL